MVSGKYRPRFSFSSGDASFTCDNMYIMNISGADQVGAVKHEVSVDRVGVMATLISHSLVDSTL